MNFDNMNTSVLRVFGEPVTFDPDGENRTFAAVSVNDWVDTRLVGGVGVRPQHVVFIPNADMTGIKNGSVLQVSGKNMTVTRVEPDDGDMSRCSLEAYR